ncbi:reverse transcriptase domain-containing protein [Tanacetum coccineum]
MFDPQDFFLPEEILAPQKRARFLSSSSTNSSAPPQVFEIGENYHGAPDTSYARHEEQIETILNHLDELPLERIEHMEDKIEGLANGRVIIQQDFDKLETELHEARAQINGSQEDINICSTTHDSGRHQETSKTPVARKCSYKEFMSCQPFNFKGTKGVVGLIRWFERPPIGIEEAYKIPWSEFKQLLIKKYCPRTEIKKMEDEFYNLTVKGNDLKTYVRRFQELAVLCPTTKNKKYICGENQESAFQLLKQKFCEAPILALPEGNDDFVVYCDASHQGLGAVLMQREKVIAYASRQLKPHEENYTTKQ